MNKFILIALSLVTSLIILPITQAKTPQTYNGMSSFDLNSQKWKNRVLLVFAPDANNATYQQQMQLLNQCQQDLNERDLLVVRVLGTATSSSEQQVDSASSAKLRQHFDIDNNDFRIILIGKDGTSKRQDSSVVQPETIFSQIDTMPMRQQEMHDRKQ